MAPGAGPRGDDHPVNDRDDVTLLGDPGAPGDAARAADDAARRPEGSRHAPEGSRRAPEDARPSAGDAPGKKPRRRLTEMIEGGSGGGSAGGPDGSDDGDAGRSGGSGGSGGDKGGSSGSEGGDKRFGWGWILLLAIIVALVLAKWTLLVAILGLAFLITVHELGHFIFAKKLGMRVERFYVGFPPAIWRRRRGETEYGLGMIPLGGFCKISGMSEEEELPAEVEPRAYYNQPVWKRNLVIFAGPLMNLVAAVVILFVFLLAQGTVTATLTLGEVVDGAPAAEAGLQPGDTLLAGRVLDDGSGAPGAWKEFAVWDDASAFLAAHPETLVELQYRPAGSAAGGAGSEADASGGAGAGSEAGGESDAADDAIVGGSDDAAGPVRSVEVRLGRNPADESAGYLGVRAGEARERPAPWTAAWMAVKGSGDIVVKTFQGFWWLVSGRIDATGPGGAAGPIGIIDVSSRAVQQGFYPILLALLSVNLAILNLIPILPFDGGHILINTIESVRGKRISPRVMERFATVGIVLVLALFLFLTLGDVRRLFG